MLEARVIGIPHIEDGEVVFAVWVQRSSSSVEVVRVTTPDPDVVYVEAHGHANEVAQVARDEVVRWIEFQRRFMDRLYARLNADRKHRPSPSHVRAATPSVASDCALCRDTGESEKFLDRSGGQARWVFGPRLSLQATAPEPRSQAVMSVQCVSGAAHPVGSRNRWENTRSRRPSALRRKDSPVV